MVVVTLDAAMRLAPARPVERGEDRFLDPGLADRSGHPDHAGIGTFARGAGQQSQRHGGILNQHVRAVDRTVDHCRGRALGKGRLDKAMAVHALALQREEQVAFHHVAAIDLDP